ncbi:MAG: hypothetical protein LAT82_05465 [Nanoarchaeota archaeon]|nr:hypothetical protein [Nanoarchaeota archaeon]
MVKAEISSELYEEFIKDKENLDSTLSTIELLNDSEAILEIQEGLKELKTNPKTYSFDEIDNL